MTKEDLLKNIAEMGYNVGYGAKVHFSTYDIVEKVPGAIGFISFVIGILSLFIDFLTTKYLSSILTILGIVSLLLSLYNKEKSNYEEVGSRLTNLFNELKILYYNVKESKTPKDLKRYEKKLLKIEKEFNSTSLSKQILLSEWYAHYKFFWQHQIEWIEEQKRFGLFRDKIPLSFSILLFFCLLLVLLFFLNLISKSSNLIRLTFSAFLE
ncbi:SLATT domain-containing protein [Leptospira borgpetersenii]|uniref:SLATT domain-containing protein n=1 Tax=Leptospira borgpetersenii TaxID=174 RepID=UPI0007745961|nr:SLATT domain-containing protein [Leptospira borgpetersenii]